MVRYTQAAWMDPGLAQLITQVVFYVLLVVLQVMLAQMGFV